MLIIDRIEAEIAVIETDSGMIELSRSLLPDNVQEGDVIAEENGSYIVDAEATAQRKVAVREKFRRLLRRPLDD